MCLREQWQYNPIARDNLRKKIRHNIAHMTDESCMIWLALENEHQHQISEHFAITSARWYQKKYYQNQKLQLEIESNTFDLWSEINLSCDDKLIYQNQTKMKDAIWFFVLPTMFNLIL